MESDSVYVPEANKTAVFHRKAQPMCPRLDMSGEEATQLAVGTFKGFFLCFLWGGREVNLC